MAGGKKADGIAGDGEMKLRYDLISPYGLEELALVYTEGAKKYDDRNWENGIPWCRIFAAMMRHCWAWFRGSVRHERGMHHLASVAWCAFALMEYEITHPELDNRPKRKKPWMRFTLYYKGEECYYDKETDSWRRADSTKTEATS